MKKILFIAMLILCSCNFLVYSQEVITSKSHPDRPIIIMPKNHDPNYLKSRQMPEKSFYESKSSWQHLIDSTWGPGDSLSRKLLIFNTYAKQVHDRFDGFISLNLNWDSLYNHYLSQINASTSKGAFSSLMSHLAYDLKDAHTHAYDTSVVYTPLNPGIPILLLGSYLSVEHFGAVTTVLPDSSTLVLRVAPHHPLNLEPGDIILGYEGIAWKDLVRELLGAGLPILGFPGGCKSADTYHNLFGAGLNWHLFSTIDIIKHSTGDTLHLSVQPLLNLDAPPMINNEQLTIPNIDFPDIFTDHSATYGILENTNIGYIYLFQEYPEATADKELYTAVKALKNTDALIIDMRLNFGGWALFDSAFSILFKGNHKTIEGSTRCHVNNFDLCPSGDWGTHQIEGVYSVSYDKPVAVLLGPSCVSMGDRTAHRLRYLSKVRFFGKNPHATLGQNRWIEDFSDWSLRYSMEDVFHINKPGEYLNRREFPVDYPVWHNADDVAIGIDAVVDKALGWINNLTYGHNVTTDKLWYSAGNDTVIVNAGIKNPNSHKVSARMYFESLDGSVTDSTDLVELISNGDAWKGKWRTLGSSENTYWISLKVADNSDGTYFTSKHSTQISTIPLMIDSIKYAPLSGSRYTFQPFLKNAGATQTLTAITIKNQCNDPWVTNITSVQRTCSDLLPGQTKGINGSFVVTYNPATFPGYFNIAYSISSEGWPFWEFDTTLKVIYTGIEDEDVDHIIFSLDQNYPNPFSGLTTFTYKLMETSLVSLQVFNNLGLLVAEPVNELQQNGDHKVQWDAKGLPAGIYYCRLQAGDLMSSVKIVKMK